MNLFRAPTENDTYGHIVPKWRNWGLDKLTQERAKVTTTASRVTIAKSWKTGAGIVIKHDQIVESVVGGFMVTETVRIPTVLADVPRIGTTFELSQVLSKLTYFGSGPVETYPDRKLAAITRCESTVKDQYVPYVVPQESGGHNGMRWFELSDQNGHKVRFIMDSPRQVSILPYTQEELNIKTHDVELQASGTTVVTIDAVHRGIGTASCGPDTLAKYLIKPGVYTYKWTVLID